MPYLRDVRLSRALSQQDLADASGVSRSAIMAIEGGRDAWPRTVQKLARALRVKPQELTGRKIGN
jgi:transcriptional regulator with XRE-family HTH domain